MTPALRSGLALASANTPRSGLPSALRFSATLLRSCAKSRGVHVLPLALLLLPEV